MAASLTSPHTPWCTIFLVVSTVIFNAMVLVGNKWTADALSEIGVSTTGWSHVGVGIAGALRTELDEVMSNVSATLLGSLDHVVEAQGNLEMVLAMVGNETDKAIQKQPELLLLQEHGPERGLVLLQEMHGKNKSHVEALVPIVLSSIHEVLEFVMAKVHEGLQMLLEKLKPALIQVGKWIQQFGDKVLAGLQDFSTTLDKAQKIFDQVMAQLHGAGNNTEEMINETWPIFDDDDSGAISVKELSNVGGWFSISALQGEKPQTLITKYDTSGDGEIGVEEFLHLVKDPSIPGALSVILRKYAKRMAEVSGQVGQAKLRDDAARAVANYVKLVCAKNLTKVGWIADRLGNESVPLDFTATVFVEMCLTAKDPNAQVYTSADTGLMLTQEVYHLHPGAMTHSFDLMSNSSWWITQGFDLKDQPACMKMATAWLKEAEKKNPQMSLLSLDVSHSEALEMLDAMPQAAYVMAEESAKLYRLERLQARQLRRQQLFSSETSRHLLDQLLGGVSPLDGISEEAEDAANQSAAGVAAAPETLEFAKFLSWNSSGRAKELQHMCFDHSSSSSNAVDDFASKIQAMLSKVTSFIQMMQKYSTPKGIEDLEAQLDHFIMHALQDVAKTVETKLTGLMEGAVPQLDKALHSAAHHAGEQIGAMIGQVISNPMIEALEQPLEEIMAKEVGNGTAAGIVHTLTNALGGEVSNLTGKTLGSKLGDALEGLLDEALDKAGEGLETLTKKLPKPKAALLAHHVDAHVNSVFDSPWKSRHERAVAQMLQEAEEESNINDAISAAWQGMVNLLRTFSNLLPQAVQTLKDARNEVSKLSSGLDSIFDVFSVKGPQIFDTVSRLWMTIWIGYFLFLMPFCGFTLYYGLWANGWFGGPKPYPEEAEPSAPQTFLERAQLLFSKCWGCCKHSHDSSLCFWSVIIFMQVIVLITFLICIVLAIFAGVKALIVTGCTQVYILEDAGICEGGLTTLRDFLTKMHIGDNEIYTDQDIAGACDANSLLTCELVSQKFAQSTIMTTVFSFLASIFSLQMLFDAATLHEQAVWRRKAAAAKDGKAD